MKNYITYFENFVILVCGKETLAC